MGVNARGTLHGVSLSPFVRKVRAVLALKSIGYELVNVMPGAMDPSFLAKSPLSKIPVWEEQGWTLPDSSVICAYLERVAPEPALYPSGDRDYATALFWEEYADTRVIEAANPIFFQRIVRGKVFKQPIEEEIVRRTLEEVLPPVLDQLESLFVERDGMADAVENIATLSVWSPFVNLAHAGWEIDAARWPGFARFLEAMDDRPVLRELIAEERASLAGF